MYKRRDEQNGEEVNMAQVTVKLIFELPFILRMQDVTGIKPKRMKRGGEEITIYPPVHTEKDMTEMRLRQLKTPKPRIAELNKLNCIVIDIIRDFPTIPPTGREQDELVERGREIIRNLLTLFRWWGKLHIGRPNVESFNYRLRLFDANGKIIGSAGMTHLTVPSLPFKSSEWGDICRALASEKVPELYEVLLLDARDVVSKEPRRAVLDAATACEVFIENFCETASKNSPKVDQIIYSALKQSKKREGEVLFYFHEVLRYLFGHSLKDDKPELYEKLGYLCKTNNSVKHEGKCQYEEKGKKVKKVNAPEAGQFINAVIEAIVYTKSLRY